MKTKILILGLICLFIFTHCNSPADPEIEKALNPGNEIEGEAKTQIRFNLKVSHPGKFPEELEEIAWYQIFEIYINDGVGTYGEGLLIHTHEFGRGGGYYYELPERNHSFIPALDFYGTKEPYNAAVGVRGTKSDYEVWFRLKESNIPSEFIQKMSVSFFIELVPVDTSVEYNFECDPSLIHTYKECFGWEVGETVRVPHSLSFRVMVL